MKISIISPSFNQSAFIGKTIESVARQTYADKEHIIVDGGSTDGCAETIREAAARLPHIKAVIEPDRGQVDAINKGFALASGDILAWLNTDDKYYSDEALSRVAEEFEKHPEADLVYGRGVRLDAEGVVLKEAFVNRRIDGPEAFIASMGVFQPSVFFRRSVFEKVGGLSEDYNLQLDYEYWIRVAQAGVRFHFLDAVLAAAVVHEEAKSTRDRLNQLSECISMIEDKYGAVPDEWIGRFARFYATRRDEKLSPNGALSADQQRVSDTAFNALKASLAPDSDSRASAPKRTIITSFDSKYLQQGLNLIASLHRTSFLSFDELLVYSLGLSDGETELLNGLEKVRVVRYPDEAPEDFPDFYEPSGRAYKVAAIAAAGQSTNPGDLVLWMDAGLACCTDIDEVFRIVEAEEFFITDHDDSNSWPFFNIHFLHKGAVEAIAPSPEELLAPHLCSCIVGYSAGGKFQLLIDEARRMGMKRSAVAWPKVLPQEEKNLKPHNTADNREYRLELLSSPEAVAAVTIDELYERFPYYGHRTQSIYSVLAHRLSAPVYSATLFHKSNKSSSRAAADNWTKGAEAVDAGASRGEMDNIDAATRIYHHRGVFTNLSGLIFKRAAEPVFIVGNGPSLRGFDFELLRGKAWLGMNAAYRFWDEQKLHPHIYACFDTVVQDSHKHEIKRLIEQRSDNGIRWFFLRRSFLDYWPEAAGVGCIFFLEDLQKSVEWFDRGKITTGSFSVYVCCFLGFSEICVLGVDLNYVEQISEAKAEGKELVIADSVSSNPNYFFDGYQQRGDRYNPPNRHPDMHLRSWNETAEALSGFPVAIVNGNPGSAVRVYPFVNRDKAVAAARSRHLRALRAAERLMTLGARQAYWRRTMLKAIGAERPIATTPDNIQTARFASWMRPYLQSSTLSAPAPTIRDADAQAPYSSSSLAPGDKVAIRQQADDKTKAHPRLLLIDHTRIGDGTATGELKAALFSDWPQDKLLQLFDAGDNRIGAAEKGKSRILDAGTPALAKKIETFAPDLILYRPAPETHVLHAVAMSIIDASPAPLAAWIMDDWPASLAVADPFAFARLGDDWRRLVARARLRLSVGEAMSTRFEQRYGKPFAPFANGVDAADWPKPARKKAAGPLTVRYAGSLAENMTQDSVRFVAEAVETLAEDGVDIRFEIKTRPLWRDIAAPHFAGLTRTSFTVADLAPEAYRDWLSQSDIAVIAYNFDDASTSYVRYSLANKLPECLASGAALLAVGPAEVATLALLEKLGCGVRVTENDVSLVKNALAGLAASPDKRLALAEHAQKTAFGEFDINKTRTRFANALAQAATISDNPAGRPREAHARVDETAVVARLLAERRGAGNVMLDVGAHHGSSAQYFNRLGWTIHCFEPDPKNREKLIERFGQTANITIDDRAVSDAPATGVSFYQSEESTGISGLSAFRDSHAESGRVDVTTVADIAADRGIKHVDFLKIDVEGFDFPVLKGVPWDILHPDVIECEFEDAKTAPMGHTWKDIASYLMERGYAVYVSEWHPIVRYGVRHDWRRVMRYGDAEIRADAWGNLLAFRADPGLPAVSAAFEAAMARPKPAAKEAKKPPAGRITAAAGRSDTIVMKRRFYGPMADTLKMRAPQAFTLLRYAKKTLGGVWRRRMASVPALFILTAGLAASFTPALSPWRNLIWIGGAFALLLAAIAYLGLRLRQFTEALAAENANLRQTLTVTRRALRQTDQKLAALSKGSLSRAAAIAALKETAIKTKSEFAALDSKTDKQLASVRAEAQKIETEARIQIQKASAGAAEKIAALEAARKKLATDLATVSDRATKTDRAATFNNALWYQRFNRRLSQDHIDTLLNKWANGLPFELTRETLGYMAHRACQIEAGMQGRLATTIEDILLRTLVAMSAKGRDLEVMEIGTLFGIGAGIMYDALAPHFDSVRMTLLDPLDGYYESKRLDILTGQPVTETVLRANLDHVGLGGDRLRLIKHLSTDSTALEQAGDRRYDVLIIDGDHTYDGVKADFDLYAPLMKPEGLIVFDDYGAKSWPDVQRYVDEEVEGLDFVERVGVDWRTCVYRVKK